MENRVESTTQRIERSRDFGVLANHWSTLGNADYPQPKQTRPTTSRRGT